MSTINQGQTQNAEDEGARHESEVDKAVLELQSAATASANRLQSLAGSVKTPHDATVFNSLAGIEMAKLEALTKNAEAKIMASAWADLADALNKKNATR